MKKGIIIDINTLHGIPNISAMDLLGFWQNEKVLLYNGEKGNKPILVDKEQGVLIDVSELPQTEIKELFEKLKAGKEL